MGGAGEDDSDPVFPVGAEHRLEFEVFAQDAVGQEKGGIFVYRFADKVHVKG